MCPAPLSAGARVSLPDGAARHVQVLRLQPGDALVLFDGQGGQWSARITAMGRREVVCEVGAHQAVEREAARAVTLALAVPANERMDALVEKATELGAHAIVPLLTTRSVLRLAGERAQRRREHWQAVAQAACEQCGRNRLPAIGPVQPLGDWLRGVNPPSTPAMDGAASSAAGGHRWLLSLSPGARPLGAAVADLAATSPADAAVTLLSGPEGGFTAEEEAAAVAAGFVPVSLGPRVLRADTAPLAALAWLTTP